MTFNADVTHHVHEVDADGSLGLYVGGANDAVSAAAIAAGLYAAAQGYTPDSTLLFAVVNETGTPVAFIGRYQVQVP